MGEKAKQQNFVVGDRPQHVHTCNAGELPHQWPCNSPYCSFAAAICVEHGGTPPVEMGHEPWRGR